MSARTRLALGTTLLVAVTAAAGGAAWWFVARREPAAKAAAERARRILDFEPGAVVALRVRAKGADAALERRDGAWRLTTPVAAPADRHEVEALLSRLAALERRAESAPAGLGPDRLRDYGLDAPTARFEVVLAGGRTLTLAIGGDNRFDGTMFVQPASGEVLVVDGRGRVELEKVAFELRERRLLRFEPGEVASVELTSPAGVIGLVQEGGALRLVAPVREAADARRAEGLLAALREVRATAFEDGPPPAGRPALEVAVRLAGGAEQRLRAWGSGGDDPVVAQSSLEGQRARVPPSALAPLEVSPMSLRDRRALPGVDREAIAAIRVEAPGGPFALARKPGGPGLPDVWSLTAPARRPLDAWRAQSLAWALAGLEGDRIVDGARSPGPIERTYVLLDAAGAELGRVAVGAPRAGEVLLGAGGRVLAIAEDRLPALAATPEALAPEPPAASP